MKSSSHTKAQSGLIALLRCNPLLREISIVLLIKLVIIYAIWYVFFNTETKVPVTPQSIEQQLLGELPDRVNPIIPALMEVQK